jgi:hypothetical protein
MANIVRVSPKAISPRVKSGAGLFLPAMGRGVAALGGEQLRVQLPDFGEW